MSATTLGTVTGAAISAAAGRILTEPGPPDRADAAPGPLLAGAEPLGWTAAEAARLGVGAVGDLYRSPALLAAEESRILARSWSVVADAAELAPGGFVTAAPGGAPVVVVRDHDGVLRAFQNLCRHRGMPVAEGCGTTGRHLTCPYHQWSFGLDGTLVRLPQHDEQFAGVDPAAWGLLPASVGEWRGMVFVNPDPDAEPLADALGPLEGRLAPWFAGPLEQVAVVTYEVDCNWKLIVENHVDVYHLWYLHARSLGDFAHRSFTWAWDHDTWWSYEPLKADRTVPAGLPWLSEEERGGIGAHLLFPNLMLVTTSDYFATYDAVPLAPGRTRLTLRVRSVAGSDGDRLVAAVRSFLSEDIVACERLHAATASPAFALGPLASTHEAPVRAFHAALRSRLA